MNTTVGIKTRKARVKAREVLQYCGINFAAETEIENILYSRGIDMILSKHIEGSEARISFKENKAIVTVNSKIRYPKKKNFVLAHELGHFELHRKILKTIHIDNSDSLSSWFSGGDHEIEANAFASELLMPEESFQSIYNDSIFSIKLINEISEHYQASITSVLLQYLNYGKFPICMIYSKDAKVIWSNASDDFILKYIPKGISVPTNSVAGEFYYEQILYDQPEEIEAATWYSNDFKYPEHKDLKFYEQCIALPNNSIISVIWNK